MLFLRVGISDDHNGIIELPLDAPIGTDIRDYLKLNDNTIEISVTPNRAVAGDYRRGARCGRVNKCH